MNFFTHPSWKFHYRLGYIVIQSLYYMFPPLYAFGFHNNFYFLKPDPYPVRLLITLYVLQLLVLLLQKHLGDWSVFLRCAHKSTCARRCMTRGCRHRLRLFFLRKLKEQHEWGWRLALEKISLQKAIVS